MSGEITYYPEKSELPAGMTPLLLVGGVFTCQSLSGGTVNTYYINDPYFNLMSLILMPLLSDIYYSPVFQPNE
jgi:hypothetical protein